jgi:hypothetical protein
VECDNQDIVGCDISCASAGEQSASSRSGGSDVVAAGSSGTAGGGLAN